MPIAYLLERFQNGMEEQHIAAVHRLIEDFTLPAVQQRDIAGMELRKKPDKRVFNLSTCPLVRMLQRLDK